MQAYSVKTACRKRNRTIDKLKSPGTGRLSEWAMLIIWALKGNGHIRVCGEFIITLNPYIILKKYLFHTIDEIFAVLQGGDEFTELDMTHRNMQFPVDESCLHLLTIVTRKDLFKYTRIPEGVSPASPDMQWKMDKYLHRIDCTIAFLDNFYVTRRTKEHIKNLEKVCA